MSSDGPEAPLRRDLRPEGEEGSFANPPATPEASLVSPANPAEGELPALESPAASARIPGDTRRPLTRFPTDEITVLPVYETGPGLDEPVLSDFAPAAVGRGILAPWALALAILALAASFFVGWAIPIALLAVGFAIAALRRPIESGVIARWALVLGLLATVYSLGWLIWAALLLEQHGG